MAYVEVNGQSWTVGSSPTVTYKLSYSKTRTDNSNMKYTFTITASTSGWFGSYTELKCKVGVFNTNNSPSSYSYQEVTLKPNGQSWYAKSSLVPQGATNYVLGTISKTVTLSNIRATEEGWNQQVHFVVDVTGVSSTYSLDENDLYVVSSSLLYTAASAPTTFTVSPSPFGSSVNLSWSGASGGTNNSIAGYEIQYRTSSDGSTWGSWHYLKDITTTSTSGSTTDVPGIDEGAYQQFTIRTEGSAGSGYYSGWKESNVVQKGKSPIAPTSFVLSCADGNTVSTYIGTNCVKATWSGQSGTVTGYQIAYRYADTNESWTDWISKSHVNSTVSTITDTWGSDMFPSGYQVQFRVRLYNEVDGTKFYSSWKDSNKLKIAGGIRINVNGECKVGTVWVSDGAGGVRRAGRVYFNRNGVITESVS